jgi:hypothetical protein
MDRATITAQAVELLQRGETRMSKLTSDEINRGFDALGEHPMAIHDHLQTLSENDRKTFMARVEASLATYPPED